MTSVGIETGAPHGEYPDEPTAGRLDDAVRAMIRRELERRERPQAAASPRRRRREALVLALFVVDAGLLLEFLPRFDDSVRPLWSLALLVGSGVLAGGYAWWRERLGAAAQHPIMLGTLIAAFVPLSGAFGLRNVGVVPLVIDPGDAIVYLDGVRMDDAPRRLTLREHVVRLEPREGWRDARGSETRITYRAGFSAMMGVTPPIGASLLCQGLIDRADDSVTIDIVRCDGEGGASCGQPFPAAFLRSHSEHPAYVHDEGGEFIDDRLLTFDAHDGADFVEPTIPVGTYRVTLRRAGCASAVRTWSLSAATCEPIAFEALQCPNAPR